MRRETENLFKRLLQIMKIETKRYKAIQRQTCW